MRAHNRYDIPVSDGVDPAGWAYGLRHFVDGRYRLVASGSFTAALRSAVTSLRKTSLPVGITVARGNHAWVLTGFTATADPAITSHFTVTSIRVVGPLWGLQSRSYGYDMRPDTKLTPKQLAGFFTPWHYAKIRMAWEGDWVSIQPIAVGATATKSQAPATAAVEPATSTHPRPSAASIPGVAASPTATATVTGTDGSQSPGAVAYAGGVGSAAAGRPGAATGAAIDAADHVVSTADSTRGWILAGVVLAVATLIGVALATRDPRRRGSAGPGAPARRGGRPRR